MPIRYGMAASGLSRRRFEVFLAAVAVAAFAA